jgi:hypothetical protein
LVHRAAAGAVAGAGLPAARRSVIEAFVLRIRARRDGHAGAIFASRGRSIARLAKAATRSIAAHPVATGSARALGAESARGAVGLIGDAGARAAAKLRGEAL